MNPLQTNNFQERKRNKIIIFVVSILLLIAITYILMFDVIPKIEQKYYGKGYFDGQINVITTINSAREIPIVLGEGNNTQVQWFSLEEVCSR